MQRDWGNHSRGVDSCWSLHCADMLDCWIDFLYPSTSQFQRCAADDLAFWLEPARPSSDEQIGLYNAGLIYSTVELWSIQEGDNSTLVDVLE